MAHPVIHFEIMSPEAPKLREFYAEAFEWKLNPAMPATSGGAGDYTVIPPIADHIGGGIGQTANGYPGHLTFYIHSDDLEATLKKIESLGGKRVLDPCRVPNMPIEIALFADPGGNTVGLVNTRGM